MTDTLHHWHIENPMSCPIVTTISVIGGKWKPAILHMLLDGTMRFGEIRKQIPPISHKMLTQQLRELEADGIVSRHVYAEIPPRVEYALTAHGLTLAPMLRELYAWGERHAASRLRAAQRS